MISVSPIKRIAVLLTVFNRKEKTLRCLDALLLSHATAQSTIQFEVFLTDDGSSDNTAKALADRNYPFPLHILQGNGSLYWNGGMNNSWNAAIDNGNFDGYLWLNNDTYALPDFWKDLQITHEFCCKTNGYGGIYVGSTCDPDSKEFSYGGFNFIGKWKLKDHFILPDGKQPQPCQCGHGNITFVSAAACRQNGILYEKYIHGGGDHDYTYTAYLKGIPILVMPHYAGECVNDHPGNGYGAFVNMPLKKRLEYLKSPFGCNLNNTLLFQKRCFPHRYPFVWIAGHLKALFPTLYLNAYNSLRK